MGLGSDRKAAGQRRRAGQRKQILAHTLALAFLIAGAGLLWLQAGHLSEGQRAKPSVILVPLDSRPVNTDLPRQLAGVAGISVTLPEPELLDMFLTPSDRSRLFGWLAEKGESDYDISIIHINELLFGGLLNSRESSQYLQTSEKLQDMFDYLLLRSRKSANRLILIYILPRLLPSQYDEVMWEYENELPELSQLIHRLALAPGDLDMTGRLRELEGIIPREIRSRYQSVYTEAYNVGLSLLDWLDLGLVDEVVVGLDDSALYGLNVKGFHDLKTLAAQRGQERAYFLHGADELAPLVIARHALDNDGAQEDFTLRYLSEGQEETLLPYEAIPLRENFNEKAAYLYSAGNGAESLLYGKTKTYPAREKWIYAFTDQEATTEQMKAYWKAIRRDQDRPARALTGLADIAKANGAWAPFIESVGPDHVYDYVDAYAGWNTAGNSLGTVMAHLVFWEAAQGFPVRERKEAADRNDNMQRLRIVDDYFYQTKVRQKLIDWTVEQNFPYLSFGIGWRWPTASNQVNILMVDELLPRPRLHPVDWAKRHGWQEFRWLWAIFHPYQVEIFPVSAEFPWPRTFEIRITGYT